MWEGKKVGEVIVPSVDFDMLYISWFAFPKCVFLDFPFFVVCPFNIFAKSYSETQTCKWTCTKYTGAAARGPVWAYLSVYMFAYRIDLKSWKMKPQAEIWNLNVQITFEKRVAQRVRFRMVDVHRFVFGLFFFVLCY